MRKSCRRVPARPRHFGCGKGFRLAVLALLGLLLMTGCAQTTRHIPAVEPFDIERYVGTWYEIARLPHSFEEGLTHVTAQYTLTPQGTVLVVNRGYDPEKNEWRTARAKAKLTSKENRGELRVTFFWPFSAAYRVIDLDQENYEYAMVTSSRMNYFWILSRSPEIDAQRLQQLLAKATDHGFDLTGLIMVDQTSRTAVEPDT